jgi:hypothetical protein
VVLEADHRAGDRRRPYNDDDVDDSAGDDGSGQGAGSLGLIWVQATAGLPSFLWRGAPGSNACAGMQGCAGRLGGGVGLMGSIWARLVQAATTMPSSGATRRLGALASAAGGARCVRACSHPVLLSSRHGHRWTESLLRHLGVPALLCRDHLGLFLACWVPRGGGRHAPPHLQAALCSGRWLLAAACLFFAGVRSSIRVKTLLGGADADNGDTRGCHFLLGGVILGRATPPLLCQGNPRSALSDRPAMALRRRPLLGGAVLAARALWLSEMVASRLRGWAVLCLLLLQG